MAKTQVPGDLIKQGAITANNLGDTTITPEKLHTSVAQEGLHSNSSGIRVLANNGLSANSSGTFVVGGTGVTSNSTGVHIGQDVAIGANVEFGVIKFANMFATENDLPSATTYHGMFAHVHGTGKGYFAHAGAWVKIIDEISSNTDVLAEGATNLYFTNARSIAAFSNGTGVSVYSNGNISIGQSVATTGNVTFNTVTANVVGNVTGNVTGVITGNVTGNVTGQVSDISNHDTDDLSEGATNLYFTSARAVAALSNGTGVSVYSNGNIAIGQSVGTTDSVTFANVVTTDITVSGNLVVQGTTTTIDSTTLSVNDAIITVASGQTAAPSLDAGIEVERGSSANVSLLWNETNDKWTFTNDGSTYANIATSTTDLAEGTNLYYTTARANTDIDARVSNTFVEALTINVNTQIDARVTKTFVDALSINANTFDSLDSSQFLRSDQDDTLSGTLTIVDLAVPLKFEESGHTGTGKYWRMPLDSGNIRFDVDTTSTNGDGTFTTYTTPLKLWANGAVTGPSKLTVTDLVVSGNLTVVGTSNQSTTTSAAVSNADIVLLSDHTGAPSSDARLIVNRGSSANVNLRWNETNDKWTFTNDGSTYANIATSTSDLAEGTNLYYTTTRATADANSAIDAKVTKAFVDALNVDADTLDGVDSLSFLRSDQADSMSGNLTVTDTITATQTVRAGNVYMTAAGSIYRTDAAGAGGFHITTNAIYPGNSSGGIANGSTSLGATGYRFNTLFTNEIVLTNNLSGNTINTTGNISLNKNHNGPLYVRVENANTGTASYTSLQLGDSGNSNRGGITLIGSGFTPSAQYRGSETYIYNNGSSGMTLHSEAAASSIKVAVNNNLILSANSTASIFSTSSYHAGVVYAHRSNASVGAPNTANHDTGTRISLYDVSATAWYAIGIESSTMWFNSDDYYKWYSDGVLDMTLSNGDLDITGNMVADYYTARITASGSGDDQAAVRFSADHQAWDTLYAGTPGSGNGWGTFWAGSSGAQYGTNGTGGVGNIWSNSANPNEYAIVGNGQTVYALQMNDGNSWTKNTADIGTDGSVNNTGVGIRYGNYASGYGRIRFYQGGSNHNTIHSFSSSWQGGSLAGHSTGAINIEGGTGVSFGPWNALDGYIDTSGNLTVAGSVTANSDRRIKTNIETIEGALDKVLKLRGVRFNKTEKGDPDKKYIGVIAQEVEEILPEVVKKADDERGTLSVDYGNMVGLLIEAIKDQQKQIEELKAKLEDK